MLHNICVQIASNNNLRPQVTWQTEPIKVTLTHSLTSWARPSSFPLSHPSYHPSSWKCKSSQLKKEHKLFDDVDKNLQFKNKLLAIKLWRRENNIHASVALTLQMARVKQQHVACAEIENVLNSRAWWVPCGVSELTSEDRCVHGRLTVDSCCIRLAFYAVTFEIDIEAGV